MIGRAFGFKIVDKSRMEIEPILARAAEVGCPVEVGLYFGDRPARALLAAHLPASGVPTVVHLDHRCLSVLDSEGREAELREQLELAARFGAGRVITHLSTDPRALAERADQAWWDRLLRRLGQVAAVSREYGLAVHIENTFDGVPFYRRLFRLVVEQGIAGVQVCFDLGHAKVWSGASLAEWLALLYELQAAGLALHLHLHANRGMADEHLSFIEAERIGITGPDAFVGPRDYYAALAELAARFPAAIAIFEVPADAAIANREHTLRRMAAAEGAEPPAGVRRSAGA